MFVDACAAAAVTVFSSFALCLSTFLHHYHHIVVMSSWRTSPDTSGPRAKCDQVVYEAIAKAAEIIVLARCPLPAPLKPSSSRFNLHVPEVEDVRYVLGVCS